MPTYQFKCQKHKVVIDYHLSFDEISNPDKHPTCSVCGEKMGRIYTVPSVQGCPTTK